MSSSHRKGNGVSVKHGISSGSYKFVIKKLEQQLQESQQLYTGLADLNASLRAKESVLLENVSSQSNNLHYVGLALFQEPLLGIEEGNTAGIAQTLLQDVKVAELLDMIGSQPRPDDPYTSQCMRRAFTPERVQQVRNMSVKQVVDQLRQLTMKVAMALQAEADADAQDNDDNDDAVGPSLLSYTVHDIVDEYTELAMLLHVVSDKANLELGVLNLDTMQQQEPPLGHWKMVLKKLQLRPDQIQHICTGFKVYTSKSTPLVAETHRLVEQIQVLTAGSNVSSGKQQGPSSSSSSSQAPATVPRNQHSSPLQHRPRPPLPPAAAAVAAAPPARPPAAAAAVEQSSSGLSDTAGNSNGPSVSSLAGTSTQTTSSNQQPSTAATAAAENKAVVEAAAASIANWSLRKAGAVLNFDHVPDFSNNNCSQPWQQFGLPTGGLTPEDSQQLEQLLEQLLRNVMKLREVHRTMTFLWLNTLDKRQLATSIVKSYPYWSLPLTMCKHLMEQQQKHQQKQQPQQQPEQPRQPSQQQSPRTTATLLSKSQPGSTKGSG